MRGRYVPVMYTDREDPRDQPKHLAHHACPLPRLLGAADRPRGLRAPLPRGPHPAGPQDPGAAFLRHHRHVRPIRGEAYFRIAELRWDSMEDLRAGFASAEARAVAEDVEKLEQWAVCRSMVLGSFEELL